MPVNNSIDNKALLCEAYFYGLQPIVLTTKSTKRIIGNQNGHPWIPFPWSGISRGFFPPLSFVVKYRPIVISNFGLTYSIK
jgi:hypothetical protein